MKKLLFFLVASLFSLSAFAQYFDWQKKVEKEVLSAAQHQPTDFLVIMAEQADVSDAYTLRSKEEKGLFVFNTLKETATRTQQNVVSILKEKNYFFQSYLINNTLFAKTDIKTIEKIALLPEVKVIAYNPSIHFDEPTKDGESSGERAIEWNISKIKADQVWALPGNPTGQGVVIGGQDTGYQWDHPALKGHYRGWNGISPDHNYNWHDAIHALDPHNAGANPCGLNLNAPCDDNNHGTHTMGTMVGDDGAGNQIGVAPGSKWVGCRNMERGWGMPSTYTECFNFFLAPTDLTGNNPDASKAPHVINNSWGCPTTEGCTSYATYQAMETAVDNLTAAGIVVVVSAGNSGSNCSTVTDAAAIFANSFTVGATNNADVIASFSSRGPAITNGINRRKPDVCAPGVNIRSSIPGSTYAGGWNGTSMAGPHVAATVALMISAKPSLGKTGNTSGIIQSILRSTAIQPNITLPPDCTTASWSANWPNNVYGDGRIDALAAVNQAVLPVKLSVFRGKILEKSNQLFWATELEVNSDFFQVEKSIDGKNFTSIGKVMSKGKGLGEERYEFFDNDLQKNINYYRLKQIDNDGSFEYSNVIVLKNDKLSTIQVSPNPTQGFLNIELQHSEEDNLTLKVINSNGQLFKTLSTHILKGKNILTLNLEDLPKGAYQILGESQSKNLFFSHLIMKTE